MIDADCTTHLEGRRIGPYLLSSRIGVGGMGEVYKARDTRLDRIVAIKVLALHSQAIPIPRTVRARGPRHLRAEPSHICTLQTSASTELPRDYLVMEYLEGETLASGSLRAAAASSRRFATAIQIADALDKAHRRGSSIATSSPAT